jgi:hypothetical protein
VGVAGHDQVGAGVGWELVDGVGPVGQQDPQVTLPRGRLELGDRAAGAGTRIVQLDPRDRHRPAGDLGAHDLVVEEPDRGARHQLDEVRGWVGVTLDQERAARGVQPLELLAQGRQLAPERPRRPGRCRRAGG